MDERGQDSSLAQEDDREAYGEERINLIGFLDGRMVHMTYTEHGDDVQVISLRKASKHEIRRYREAISKNR